MKVILFLDNNILEKNIDIKKLKSYNYIATLFFFKFFSEKIDFFFKKPLCKLITFFFKLSKTYIIIILYFLTFF